MNFKVYQSNCILLFLIVHLPNLNFISVSCVILPVLFDFVLPFYELSVCLLVISKSELCLFPSLVFFLYTFRLISVLFRTRAILDLYSVFCLNEPFYAVRPF